MKWYLIWIVIVGLPNGEIESKTYVDVQPSYSVCAQKQEILDAKLLQLTEDETFIGFTTICEQR